MRYAVLGDIHGNWEALSAVLDDARRQRVEAYLCVGDTVGYNADPARCLEALRELRCESVQGNHDFYVVTPPRPGDVSDMAAAAIRWTRGRLGAEALAWLSGLPRTRTVGGLTLVHGTLDPVGISQWSYVFTPEQAAASFARQRGPVCFNGHTHLPLVFEKRRRVTVCLYNRLVLDPSAAYLINVGSVGQPRDRDARAAYVVYDAARRLAILRRVPYDIETARAKIRAAGLPDWLGLRLGVGM